MRGIESLPVTLIAVAVLLLIIAAVGFTQIQTFLDFNQKKLFKEDMARVAQEIKFLKSTGNTGSFTTKSIRVPSGYILLFDIDNNVISGVLADEVYNITVTALGANLTSFKPQGQLPLRNQSSALSPGEYSILLHYGTVQDSQMRDLMLTFE